MGVKIVQILDLLNNKQIEYTFLGDKGEIVEGFSSIYDYRQGTFTWARSNEVLKQAMDASICNVKLLITVLDIEHNWRAQNILTVEDPHKAFFTILEEYYSEECIHAISDRSVIDESVRLGENVHIGNYCTIGKNVLIGDNTFVANNVVIADNVKIGKDCLIKSGASIGEVGYGPYWDEDGHLRTVKHYASVSIGNSVYIGTNTTIDRGVLFDTTIGDYCKIENLCHIAHNTRIGENTLVIAGAIVSGSVVIGKNCWISTSVIKDRVTIGEQVTIGIGSVVLSNVESNCKVFGNPARIIERK